MIKASEGIVVTQEINPGDEQIKTESGIVVPKPLEKGQKRAKVIDVGIISDGYDSNGMVRYRYPIFRVGDTILFKEGTGWEHEDKTGKYRFLRFDDILGVVSEDPQ